LDALKVWRAYMEGSRHQITIYTDHTNLIYFVTSKTFTRRQTRWWHDIGSLDFKIIYRAGTTMGKPDALSRRPNYSEGTKASQAPPTLFLKPHQYDFSAMEGWKESKEVSEITSCDSVPLTVLNLSLDNSLASLPHPL
jgi:hypothetical protein